jgi:hypothetical protein
MPPAFTKKWCHQHLQKKVLPALKKKNAIGTTKKFFLFKNKKEKNVPPVPTKKCFF